VLNTNAQVLNDRFEFLEDRLEEYAIQEPKINKVIDISITGSISEFALAFSRETEIKEILVSFNEYAGKLQMDLKSDTLDAVVKKISEVSKKNVIGTDKVGDKLISGYFGASDFESALGQLATRNNLELIKKSEDYYILDRKLAPGKDAKLVDQPSRKKSKKSNRKKPVQNFEDEDSFLELTFNKENALVTVEAIKVPLSAIIKKAAEETGENYYLFDEVDTPIDLKLTEVGFEQMLEQALSGTEFAFKKQGKIFLIGKGEKVGVLDTKVMQFQHRTVKDISTFIPEDLIGSVSVIEFVQLNSVILSGPASEMDGLMNFLREIDKSVPVVMIELLIVDVQNNNEIRAGLEAGVASEPIPSGGTVFPGFDFTFSTGAINNLLSTLAGNGVVNLGQVTPNFYARLQAVEENGYINVRSKPRLSTLNGVEANLTLGETRYYLNERTTLQGNQNPISLQDRRFEAVNADFSIKIIPVVSGDEYVTLEIEVNQSDFIGQVQNNAPPPQVNRTFNSNIRILNQEMIVLGGLESKSSEDSGSGVPFLARIPVIKWLFSKRKRVKSKSKLLVFVRPTVIY